MTYRKRIERSLRFIRENLDRSLTLDEIARESHFSSYHFHRIFRAVTGETVNECTNRLRLERTVHLLRFDREKSITDIAYQCGYSSPANFAKAFKAYFGVTPRQVRQPATSAMESAIGKLFSKYGKVFQPEDLYPEAMENSPTTAIEVRQLAEKIVCQLASPAGYQQASLFETWDKLNSWAEVNGVTAGQQERFALCHDNPLITPPEKCRYEAAIVVESTVVIKEPFVRGMLPAGPYAIMPYQGPAAETAKAYMRFYAEWLPDSGFEPDHFPPIEHYLNDMRQDGFVHLELFIKLQPMRSDL